MPTPSLYRAQTLLEFYVLEHYVPDCVQPRHGPGAVAGRERLNEKWRFSTLYETLHAEWPYYEFLFGVRSSCEDIATKRRRTFPLQLAYQAKDYRRMTRVDSPVARLLTVPKDSRGPRVISCEPKELMYIQQGISRHLMSFLMRNKYTKGHVNFDDQTINRDLALTASATSAWSTIDLSDASDRVGVKLIKFLYPERVSKKWLAARSTATILPGGGKVQLEKFAPMGSALCFPVESLTFWAVAVGCIWEYTRNLREALDSVYVYGDDIIVKTEYDAIVKKSLTCCCLLVNSKKSFFGLNPFRESCGMDALLGHCVTPSRVRKRPPQRPSDGTALVAYAEYADLCRLDMPNRAAAFEEIVQQIVGTLPRTRFRAGYLSFVDPENAWGINEYPNAIWDASLCYFRSKLLRIGSKPIRSDFPSNWNRLQYNLILGSDSDPSLVVDRSSTQIRRRLCFITEDVGVAIS